MATATEPIWVLDTSVAAGWFLAADLQHESALLVLDDLRVRPHRYIVPPLFYSELAHVLSGRSGRHQDLVRSAFELVVRLGLRTTTLADTALRRLPDWACTRLGGYDGTFVALAEDLAARWLTADAPAARVASGHSITLEAWVRAQPET